MPNDPTLSYDDLNAAVAGSSAALRLTLKLEAVSPKVFPPTYEGGKYATEDRNINGQKIPCVLLDSVPSQANRMELALQDAIDGGLFQLPLVSVNFAAVDNPGLPKITSLQAPHRIADAILRDSTIGEGKKPAKFRESEIGKELDKLSAGYATPLLGYAPHCLVFGMWDSTGPRGGLGVKFARALVSEIIGVNAVPGVTSSSRIDPLNIRVNSGTLYKAKGGGWTLDSELAEKDPKTKKAVLLGKDGKPSEANHGNVTPDLVYRKDKNGNLVLGDSERPVMMVVFDNEQERGHKYVIRDERKPIAKGGFTIDYAEQTTVLSLPALRRLRFPAKSGEKSTPEGDNAARTYLAALGLLGATLAVEAGYDLRSRCLLRATNAVTWHLLGKPGDADKPFALDKIAAIELYNKALAAVQKAKLPVHLEEIVLTPSADLVTLVKKSMELAAAEAGTED
ncbi:CRISPR-associated protein GSU0053 OS=Haliangium ochraceum (strain DSM 14365 / JCM 11303 / SMP-2) GN=Hoch_4848 PE=4 SV=1: Cas_GSU0053 [Gemmata massiliana]|uniref:Type I-U CRISPR-associated protein Cas7 n=1 Tax=Gemmata massiliana TaxID=1210884 RepID=A0A6P2DHU5_9BACT|nr:type I-U CRISPR-associated RAMP protein Csb1/Cas7u [Gemmata massiliana]VTS01347.1 CRISPR-associated protein GSU0053 OS=Haliangium ochraceum (strain DSM 14365 / JCM 11303 / SMP-2) GN=Hoch_4848 PE=4 SV=1: Cas_GSU0053 [Gemmata massiliana]